MGNTHSNAYSGLKPKKNVHWRAADRPSVPGKPEIIPILSEDEPNSITLKWSNPKQDGGAPLQGFQVECNRLGSPIWIHTSPPIVSKPELILTGLEPGYRYQFRVAAVNAVGASNFSELSDILTIASDYLPTTAPHFLTSIKDVTCLENEKIEFHVSFEGVPTPNISWFKDGYEIFSSRRTSIINTDNSSTLIFHQTILNDEGEIKCTATNRAGHVTSKAKLIIEAAPKLRYPRQYEDGLLYETNETIFLKMSLVGKPTPHVEWRHDGRLLVNNERVEINTSSKFSILKIQSAQRMDRGEYQVIATNSIGEDLASFLVTITAPPDPPRKVMVTRQVDKSVTLTWLPPEDDGGCQIGNYIVEYYRSGWNVWLKAATSRKSTVTLFDLIEGSEYRFRAKAESPYGISDPSEESAAVLIPGKSIDSNFLAIESRIINDSINREDVIPAVSPRRKRNYTKKESNESISNLSDEYIYARTPPMDNDKHSKQVSRDSSERVSTTTKSLKNDATVTKRAKKNIDSKKKNLNDSSEFMLVLYSEEDVPETDKRKSFQLDLEEALSPPPISFSAPDLSERGILFKPLRNSVSSTELLHERAMARFYKAVEIEEARNETRNQKEAYNDIPVSSSIKKEKHSSLSTEKHVNNIAIKEKIADLQDEKSNINILKMTSSNEGSLLEEQQKRGKWQNDLFDEDYTASTVSTGSEQSVNGNFEVIESRPQVDLQELTYNPREKTLRTVINDNESLQKQEESGKEKQSEFILKPILKKSDELEKIPRNKPEKTSLLEKVTKGPLKKPFNIFPRKTTKKAAPEVDNKVEKLKEQPKVELKSKQEDDYCNDEGKTVIDYYGSIVKEYGSNKKVNTPLYLKTEELKAMAEEQNLKETLALDLSVKTNKNNILSNRNFNKPRKVALTTVEHKKNNIKNDKELPKGSAVPKCQNVGRKVSRASIVIPIDYDQLEHQAKINVRSVIDYAVDLCLLVVAFWFYFFKDERLAVPFLLLIIYRQLQETFFNNMPKWIDQYIPKWLKEKNK